jgi:hypothetical protein
MTRVFLAAGVAALAIAAPANAGPGGHGGGKGGDRPQVQHGGGGGGHQQAQAFGGGRHGGGGQRAQAFAGGGGRHGGGGGFAAPRMQHQQHFAAAERPQRAQHVQMRAERQQTHGNRMNARSAQREQIRANHAQAQNRMAERQQLRANRAQAQNRMAERQQMRANRAQAQNRMAERQQMRANQAQNHVAQREKMQLNRQNRMAERQQLRANRQMNQQNLMAQRQQLRGDRMAAVQNQLVLRNNARFENVDRVRAFAPLPAPLAIERTRFIPVGQAAEFIGAPISTVDTIVPLAAFPAGFGYLYPDTPNYYYQYGGGYAYQVDRSSGLIAALLPLLAGGFLPGQYVPNYYMNSYVPSYYGLDSFYPASYGGYAPYGYDNLCNRYEYGVVYQVDCYTGLVQNVIPLYAGGYGVGQMLPSAYSYYNVPLQYRSMYYPTADYSYWYAPGAIYQYSPQTSLITSVAALMSPGFTVGQPLPAGYGMYNVPLAYRSTYYDTQDAWYRYNNGYIYQVNPATQLVTAIVASLLT